MCRCPNRLHLLNTTAQLQSESFSFFPFQAEFKVKKLLKQTILACAGGGWGGGCEGGGGGCGGSTWNRRSVLGGVTAGEYTGSMPVNSSAKFPVSSSFFSSGLKGLATFFSASSAQLSP